ncbi:MAG TPA: hypothetical protein VFL28_02190 [bacterium]|nr:hypothetical protein [bacterium]
MKHFFAGSLAVCALLGIGSLTPARTGTVVRDIGVRQIAVRRTPVRYAAIPHIAARYAGVRHIAINHSPAAPLRTVEISKNNPTPTVVPPSQGANACVGAPPTSQAPGPTCSPQPQSVAVTVVQIPVQ